MGVFLMGAVPVVVVTAVGVPVPGQALRLAHGVDGVAGHRHDRFVLEVCLDAAAGLGGGTFDPGGGSVSPGIARERVGTPQGSAGLHMLFYHSARLGPLYGPLGRLCRFLE
uniref:Putative secreted protein n=1 Tax=Ixodes ricinus TaxID=34613 RepID=A0A147BTW6_IXORI